jgi:hypothetical protein
MSNTFQNSLWIDARARTTKTLSKDIKNILFNYYYDNYAVYYFLRLIYTFFSDTRVIQ